MASDTDTSIEPWTFLLGLPPIEEYFSWLKQAAGEGDFDVAAANSSWRHAADVYNGLQTTEVRIADAAAQVELPPEYSIRATKYLKSPQVIGSYSTVTPTLELVPLDELVVFQRQINLRYAKDLTPLAEAAEPGSDALFDYCLSLNQNDLPIKGLQVSQNTFIFSTPSTDARFLEAKLVNADELRDRLITGRPTSSVVLSVGYGVNAINVLRVGGRLILNNGSHRAYALLASGAKHAIAVVQNVSRIEELGLCPQVQQNQNLYLTNARPPLLKDYFNSSLTARIDSPRKLRHIRIQYVVEVTDVPG